MKISVIIPIYNAEAFLEKAVNSVLLQAEVMQVLLVEDGSSDNSLHICEQLAQKDGRIEVLRHEGGVNRGVAASRNLGMANANGDYLAFLDADDWYLENRFARTKQVFLANPSADGVYECLGISFSTEEAKQEYLRTNRALKNTTTSRAYAPSKLFEALVSKEHVSFDAITLKRSSVMDMPHFNEHMKQAEDTDFLWRLAESKRLFAGQIEQPVAVRNVHGANSIFNAEEVHTYKEKLLETWLLKSRHKQWSTRVNRYLTFRYLKTQRKSKVGLFVQLFKLIIAKPWLLKKLLF